MRTNAHKRQSGAALLLLLLIVVVAASAVLVTKLSHGKLRNKRLTDTQHSLALAKQALIEYATTYSDFSTGAAALLPCPDIDASGSWLEGEAHTSGCGAPGVTVIGRLPWKSLGYPPLHDASGACLWYVVSGTYKDAAAATLPMINPDTNGQLQLYSVDGGLLIEGNTPADRPVAMIFAALEPLYSQIRPGTGVAGQQCSSGFAATNFLDDDAGLGISNAFVSGIPDSIDSFAIARNYNESHNDRVVVLRRDELAAAIHKRHDFDANIAALTRGIAACTAFYGMSNAAGAADRRLPWPAQIALADYSDDNSYDDVDSTVYSGRVPDIVDNSAVATVNPVSQMLRDCDAILVPEWDSTYFAMWQTWKDHFFYAVADAFQPTAAVPSVCGNCLSINGAGQFAAVILFSGRRLPTLGQIRDQPPIDTDTKNVIGNYLEGLNASNHPYSGGAADYQSQAVSSSFNDVAYCVDTSMLVSAC